MFLSLSFVILHSFLYSPITLASQVESWMGPQGKDHKTIQTTKSASEITKKKKRFGEESLVCIVYWPHLTWNDSWGLCQSGFINSTHAVVSSGKRELQLKN